MRLEIRTNSKLNLYLRVVGKRSDGFHELESVFHGVGLADDLSFETNDSGQMAVEMTIDGSISGEPPELEDDLVYKAATLLAERAPKGSGALVRIHKRIPIGAGLGGGSGNAAGALVALNELWKLEQDRDALVGLGSRVGSDVPYCVWGGTALAMSRGEVITPLPAPKDMSFVLGISLEPLSTKTVYDTYDEVQGDGQPVRSAGIVLALGSSDTIEIASLLYNDLEKAAFSLRPELIEKKQELLEAGALGAGMSGSGPTLFGVARDETHASEIAERVEGRFDLVRVVQSVANCVERVA